MFNTPDRPGPDNALNLQVSVEQGRAGFDWVLLAPRNIEDRERFMRFATDAGYQVEAREMNRVTYLRVEGGDLAALLSGVVVKLYGVSESMQLDMIAEGFAWKT